MLRVRNLSAAYGAIRALDNVSLDIAAGEIVCLIGANGAGKSTLLRSICGSSIVQSGQIMFDARDITRDDTASIINNGLAHVPEGRRIFSRMTVLENLQTGAHKQDPAFFDENLARVYSLFPRLKERAGQQGGTLSGGEQQMLALSRALMARPKMLLLDEPSLGLAPLVVKQIFETLVTLNQQQGLTIFLVEQNANLALKVSQRGYVLANGKVLLQGSSDELRRNKDVQAAYLEGSHA